MGVSMEIHHVVLLLLLVAVKAYSQLGDPTLLRIDCGAQSSYDTDAYDGSHWETDGGYTTSGTNEVVSINSFTTSTQLNSLRVFRKGNRNCYDLPAAMPVRHFMRASFYYGNYDGKSKALTFDLEFNGNKWATIETSSTEFQYQEVIHTSRGNNLSICLVQTKHGEFPFISALEIWPLPEKMYAGMSRNLAWIKSYRYNYGAPEYQWIGFPDDTDNRLWQPITPSGLIRVTSDAFQMNSMNVNNLPDDVITEAVEAPNLSTPINLNFTLPGTNSLNYIALYFTEVKSSLGDKDTRYIDVYVNNNFTTTMIPEFGNCSWAWVMAQLGNDLIIQLRANSNSTLPPVISAIEVYTATGDGSSSSNNTKNKKKQALIIGSSIVLVALLLVIGVGTVYLRRREENRFRCSAGNE